VLAGRAALPVPVLAMVVQRIFPLYFGRPGQTLELKGLTIPRASP
jgi:hypothetical protein